MLRKNLSIILVVLLTLLLIALVIWVFDKRIKSIDKKIKPSVTYLNLVNDHPTMGQIGF
jgi:hypothetical protein